MGKVGIHAFLQMKTHVYGRDQKGGEPSALSPCMTSTNMMLMRKDAAQIGPAGKSPRKRTEETGSQPWEVRDRHKTAREQRMEAKEQIRPSHSGRYMKAVLNHQAHLYPRITLLAGPPLKGQSAMALAVHSLVEWTGSHHSCAVV